MARNTDKPEKDYLRPEDRILWGDGRENRKAADKAKGE